MARPRREGQGSDVCARSSRCVRAGARPVPRTIGRGARGGGEARGGEKPAAAQERNFAPLVKQLSGQGCRDALSHTASCGVRRRTAVVTKWRGSWHVAVRRLAIHGGMGYRFLTYGLIYYIATKE